MLRHLLPVLCLVLVLAPLAAAPVLDGATAAQWQPCTGWVSKAPSQYGVSAAGKSLVFSAEGAGTEMPWILNLDRLGVSGDERYILVRYRGRGLDTRPSIYFLHGEEGTHGGRAYAMADELQPDGEWHTLAVDLLAVQPQETTHNLAVKVFVDASGSARLEVEKFWFSNDLPADAKVARVIGKRAEETLSVAWQQVKIEPQTGWTTAPATDFSATPGEGTMAFSVRGQGKGMRWLLALPQPVDLARLPYLSLRYRASGAVAGTTYAIWLGDRAEGTGGTSLIALPASDLQPDGAWHNLTLKLAKTFTPTHLAVGLDCDGEAAGLELSDLTFTSAPLRWALQQVLPYAIRPAPWPVGHEGYTTLAPAITGGVGSPFLAQRLGLSDWFSAPQVTVAGVPFAVPTEPGAVVQSSTTGLGALSLKLAAPAKAIYLLTAALAPATEPWGIDWQNPKPLEVLDVPEKVCFEVRYASGPSDFILPEDVASGQWGLRRGLSVSVVRPDPQRRATELLLHDRMQTASFALVGATLAQGQPQVSEPTWRGLAYPAPPRGALAKVRPATARSDQPAVNGGLLHAAFATEGGLTWANLSISGLPGKLACDPGPVFEVSVGGKLLPASDWHVESAGPDPATGPAGRRFVVRNATVGLRATVDCAPGRNNELLLRMKLANEGSAALQATVQFPVLRGLKLGSAADTWYLAGKRGGIINHASVSFRDPLGERHPLQMDGFFNPKTGLALACLTHDTVAQHHFSNFAKGEAGGSWAPEYYRRDLAPGQSFATTEAALVLREGDWRAIFAAYTEWLHSWFAPVAPRKPWFEKTFALISGNAHYDSVPDPKTRGNVQRLVDTMRKYIGPCDYAHLFGWGSSKQYGDWGDYDHYEEVGGLDYFRENIQKAQQAGIAVSLYLDGYLSSEKGQFAGARAKEWAMKRPDGSPQYVKEYDSYNECPYKEGWRSYLAETYARVKRDLGAKILYIDEIGATDGRWSCSAADHGHNSYEIPYAGEVKLLQAIRQAVGPETVLYTEYPPAEVSRQYTDGSITYQALWSAPQEPLAPHFIDLPRFAFPDFKQMHIIYYVTTRAGNWWLLKYPFFNGELYRIGEPNLPGMDAASMAFQKQAVLVQCAHREAFASHSPEPLVDALVTGVFANRFPAAQETVWTLYNANGRSVRTPVLRVKHIAGATYEDAWNGRKLTPKLEAGQALLAVELGPKAVGCVVQRRP